MERRDLIKALIAMPTILHPVGDTKTAIAKIEKGKHVMFYDDNAIDITDILSEPPYPDDPLEGMVFIAVNLNGGRMIDDVLKIFKLE